MNLSTASSASRAKEVGIRKVLGTEKKFLIGQFLTESFYDCALISLVLRYRSMLGSTSFFNKVAAKGNQHEGFSQY